LGKSQDERQENSIELLVRLRVQVLEGLVQPLVVEALEAKSQLCSGWWNCSGLARRSQRLGQEGRDEDRPAGLQRSWFQDALQFTNVARPGIVLEPLERRRSNLADLPAKLPAKAPQVVIDQHRQVVAPLAQGRQ